MIVRRSAREESQCVVLIGCHLEPPECCLVTLPALLFLPPLRFRHIAREEIEDASRGGFRQALTVAVADSYIERRLAMILRSREIIKM